MHRPPSFATYCCQFCGESRCHHGVAMESGGSFSLPQFTGAIERILSSAESDSAFSVATEAESEITDGGDEEGSITPRQTYFMCYATDLLSAYERIKKRSVAGVKAIDEVSDSRGGGGRRDRTAGLNKERRWRRGTVVQIWIMI